VPEDPFVIPGAPVWYNDKIYAMMGGFGARLHDYLVGLGDVQSKEINMIIASFGKFYFSPSMKTILSKLALSGDDDVSRVASDACRALYSEVLVSAEFLSSGNIHVRRNAIRAASAFPSKESVSIVLDLMADGSVREDCAAALSEMASKDSHLLQDVIFRFVLEQDPTLKVSMAEILSERIEYLLARMRHDGSEQMKSLIADIAGRGGISGLIGFLNGNTDRNLEERICGAIAGLVGSRYDINSEFRLYLDERILPRFGLTRLEPMKGSSRKEAVRTDLLTLFLALAVLPFPIAFLAGFHGSFPAMGLSLSVKTYLSFFTYLFAFYGIAINSIYLLLLLFSFIGADRQIRRWRDKNLRFLFKPGILPSISIIAPAYGEEATIVESVSSLLNLHYPDFEVIVVNDGSPDGTLLRLIGRFGLERVDRRIKERLKTAPVRGIYRNRHIPNLTVVDKVNGGKGRVGDDTMSRHHLGRVRPVPQGVRRRKRRISHGAGTVPQRYGRRRYGAGREAHPAFLALRKTRTHQLCVQRELLDIMTFHIGILFNPRYREVGLVAFPYFILFEVIGPWIEFQGLAVFAISLALGLLTGPVVILLLIGTIFMGIAVSIVSFYILGRGSDYFTKRDFLILIFYAFLENFGIRQFFSVSRLGGYIDALRNKQGWGRVVRRGFQRPD
jgi:glycosyltransferase involved in cell wall biosynthesis